MIGSPHAVCRPDALPRSGQRPRHRPWNRPKGPGPQGDPFSHGERTSGAGIPLGPNGTSGTGPLYLRAPGRDRDVSGTALGVGPGLRLDQVAVGVASVPVTDLWFRPRARAPPTEHDPSTVKRLICRRPQPTTAMPFPASSVPAATGPVTLTATPAAAVSRSDATVPRVATSHSPLSPSRSASNPSGFSAPSAAAPTRASQPLPDGTRPTDPPDRRRAQAQRRQRGFHRNRDQPQVGRFTASLPIQAPAQHLDLAGIAQPVHGMSGSTDSARRHSRKLEPTDARHQRTSAPSSRPTDQTRTGNLSCPPLFRALSISDSPQRYGARTDEQRTTVSHARKERSLFQTEKRL
jgi:hypothetical protein